MSNQASRILAAFAFAFAVSFAAGAAQWSQVTRDVYVDGALAREALVFAEGGSERLAVVAAALPRVVVFDQESFAVSVLEKDRLELAALPSTAVSAAEPSEVPAATCVEVGARTHLLRLAGHTILVARHLGRAGEMSRDELWTTAPVWKHLKEAYEPDPAAVAALAAVERDVEVTVAFGTWCGDSKRYVPELLKALEAAENPRLGLVLMSLEGGLEAPLGYVRDERLTNVPTMIVHEGGREIGRIVETPAGESFEADLAAILAGETPVHPGRWSRDRRLLGGVYRYTDAAGVGVGTEEWEIFADGEERLMHCTVRRGGGETEIWQRRGAAGDVRFVEITRRSEGELSRSRHWIEDGQLLSITRGNTTGIIEQKAELPQDWALVLPAAVAAVPRAEARRWTALELGGAGQPAAGRIVEIEIVGEGREEVEGAFGRLLAERVERRGDAGSSRWWLHPELGVPVRGSWDGGSVVLTELEVADTP